LSACVCVCVCMCAVTAMARIACSCVRQHCCNDTAVCTCVLHIGHIARTTHVPTSALEQLRVFLFVQTQSIAVKIKSLVHSTTLQLRCPHCCQSPSVPRSPCHRTRQLISSLACHRMYANSQDRSLTCPHTRKLTQLTRSLAHSLNSLTFSLADSLVANAHTFELQTGRLRRIPYATSVQERLAVCRRGVVHQGLDRVDQDRSELV
jgi:hypothetical protein